MYGCINQYIVILDDEQFMVLEYDLENLNSTAESYMEFIDENGYDAKTNDPAWHNGEFLLRNSFSVLENGEVKAEFSVNGHPKRVQILEAFQAFEQLPGGRLNPRPGNGDDDNLQLKRECSELC